LCYYLPLGSPYRITSAVYYYLLCPRKIVSSMCTDCHSFTSPAIFSHSSYFHLGLIVSLAFTHTHDPVDTLSRCVVRCLHLSSSTSPQYVSDICNNPVASEAMISLHVENYGALVVPPRDPTDLPFLNTANQTRLVIHLA
jgi:hypothetical protein